VSTELPIVSDHAVLRWMERVEGYDIAALRAALARSGAVGLQYGARSVVVGKGKLVIRDGAVVTVLMRHHHRRDLIGEIEIEIDATIAAHRKTGRRRRR